MDTIEIDFDVYKGLTALRTSETVSYNDVIRRLLGLSPVDLNGEAKSNTSSSEDWTSKGVRFPAGTEFKGAYKGKTYFGRVEKGALVVNGTSFTSPSPAANLITGTSTDGWKFWSCKLPNQTSWKQLKNLRNDH